MANSSYVIPTRKHAGILIKYTYVNSIHFYYDFIDCLFTQQSDSQWVIVNLDTPAVLKKIEIKFQGGFSSSMCTLEAKINTTNEFKKITEFYPNDDNSNQVHIIF